MATEFLKNSQAALLHRIGTDVTYQQFVESASNVNATTREIIDEEGAYPNSVTLKALVDYRPSQATRHALGVQQDVVAILTILIEDCIENGVILSGKDRFTLPDGGPYYISKIVHAQQSGDEFLTYQVALVRKAGGKRNR